MPLVDESWSVIYRLLPEYNRAAKLVGYPGPELYSPVTDKWKVQQLAERHDIPPGAF
jgi:hypothetical protein